MGFLLRSWLLFLATHEGKKTGVKLPYHHPFSPEAGSIVNVWVEPNPGELFTASGELFGDLRVVRSWGLGCCAALRAHWPTCRTPSNSPFSHFPQVVPQLLRPRQVGAEVVSGSLMAWWCSSITGAIP